VPRALPRAADIERRSLIRQNAGSWAADQWDFGESRQPTSRDTQPADHQTGAASNTVLLEQLVDVRSNRAMRDSELQSNLLVRQTSRNAFQDLILARAYRVADRAANRRLIA